MLYSKYLLKRGNSFFISKLYIKSTNQLPYLLPSFLILGFAWQQYKRLRLLIFILLNILTTKCISILETKLNYYFYININLIFIFNLVNIYLSNIDIAVGSLLLNKGKETLEISLSYNKFPIVLELDNFFEQVLKLLTFVEEATLSLKLYLYISTLIGGETFLRFLKLPIYLVK